MTLKDLADPGSASNPLRPVRAGPLPSTAAPTSPTAGLLERVVTLEGRGAVPLLAMRHG